MANKAIRVLALVFASFMLSVCSGGESERYMPPRFESVLAEPGGLGTASLRCTVSDGRIESCGFLYGVGERLDNRLECELSGLAFEAKLTGLSDGTAYSFCAYASAGGAEIKSETYTFRSVSRNEPVPIEDPAFKTWLVQQGYDTDSDGEISYEEARRVTSINITPTNKYNLQSLKGIEYMPNLEYINCIGEWYETPGKSTPPDREYYYIGLYRNNWDWWGPIGTLRYVDVSGNAKLKELHIDCNSALGETMGTIDVAKNPELEALFMGFTALKYADISNCLKLRYVGMSHLHGDLPDFSAHNKIEVLHICYPQDEFLFHGTIERIDLDVSHMSELRSLSVNARIRSLSDLSANKKLNDLSIENNALMALDVSSNPLLERLYCGGNGLNTLDVSNNTKLFELNCAYNHLTSLDLSNNTVLEHLNCYGNRIESLDLSGNQLLKQILCWDNPLGALDVSHLEYLEELLCANIGLTSLDVTHNPRLKNLAFNDNLIGSIDLSGNPLLEDDLACWNCGLSELDVSHNPMLKQLRCWGNNLKTLDVSGNLHLSSLWCAPMDDSGGHNLFETLYIAPGQSIPLVTENRSAENIPPETIIKIVNN